MTDTIRPLNSKGFTPEVVLEQVRAAKPTLILITWIDEEGSTRTAWSSMSNESFCYLKCHMDLMVQRILGTD